MGYWNNNLYIEYDDIDSLTGALTELAQSEGRTAVVPEPRAPEQYDEMQYGAGDTWRMGAALIPGIAGWTIVKTAPLEWLLYEQRIAKLAQKLGAQAFQHNVYDSSSDLLFEASASGQSCITGFCAHEVTRFHGVHPEPEQIDTRFCLIDTVPILRETNVMAASAVIRAMAGESPPPSSPEERSQAIGIALTGGHLDHIDNLISVHYLVTHQPLPAFVAKVVYFDRALEDGA
jgi:hypothetical protein